MENKLLSNMGTLEKLVDSRIRDYEDKLQNAESATTSAHSDLQSLSQEFSEFKSFVYQSLDLLKTQIGLLTSGLDRHETSMRRKVLLIHGMQEKPNENLSDSIVHIINTTLNINEVSVDNLEVCHRLGTGGGKTRPVLIRFRDMEHRRLVWDSKKSLKGSGITISEFLTKTRHQVFLAARQHFGVNNCWSSEGKIVIITPDEARRKVVSLGELEPLLRQFPACTTTGDNQKQAEVATSSPARATPKPKRKARRL